MFFRAFDDSKDTKIRANFSLKVQNELLRGLKQHLSAYLYLKKYHRFGKKFEIIYYTSKFCILVKNDKFYLLKHK